MSRNRRGASVLLAVACLLLATCAVTATSRALLQAEKGKPVDSTASPSPAPVDSSPSPAPAVDSATIPDLTPEEVAAVDPSLSPACLGSPKQYFGSGWGRTVKCAGNKEACQQGNGLVKKALKDAKDTSYFVYENFPDGAPAKDHAAGHPKFCDGTGRKVDFGPINGNDCTNIGSSSSFVHPVFEVLPSESKGSRAMSKNCHVSARVIGATDAVLGELEEYTIQKTQNGKAYKHGLKCDMQNRPRGHHFGWNKCAAKVCGSRASEVDIGEFNTAETEIDEMGFAMIAATPEDGTEVDLYASTGNGKALGLFGKAVRNPGGRNKVRNCMARVKCLGSDTDAAEFPEVCDDNTCSSVHEIAVSKADGHGQKVGHTLRFGLRFKPAGQNLGNNRCKAVKCGRKAEGLAVFGDLEASIDTIFEAVANVTEDTFPVEGEAMYTFENTPVDNKGGLRGKAKSGAKKRGPCVKNARCLRDDDVAAADEDVHEFYVETDEVKTNGAKGNAYGHVIKVAVAAQPDGFDLTDYVYTHGPNKGQRGPWHSCNRASCQFRGAKIAAGVDFSDESAAGVLDSIVDTPDGTEAVIYVDETVMSVKKNAAGWPNGWLQKCLKGAKCTKRAGHDATVDADEVDYTVEREVSYGGLTKKVTFPLKLKPNFRGAGYVLFKSCAKLGACDGAGKQAEFVLPNDTNLTTMSKNGLGDDKWDAMFGFLGVDSQCLDGVKCVDADGVTPEGAVTLTLKENPKFNVSISLLAVKKPENTVVSAACDGAGVCSAAGKVISLTGLLADGVSIMTGGTVAAAYSVVSTPADASTDCIDGSTVACSASATAAIGPFTYTITKSGVSYNASFYAGARKGFCSAASGHGACYSNGRLNACGASGQCSRAYCTAAASCNTDDQPFCGGYKAFSIGQWSQTCSRDTSKVDCTPSGQKGNPGCWAKGCIAESRSPCPSGDAKCAKLNSLHVFGEAQLNGLGSCGPFRISNPSGSAFIQLNSMTCISEMLPMSPLDGPVEALGSSTSITCGHPTDMTGSWANANSVPPKNRLLSELVVSLMNVHCIGTVVSNKNLQSVELSSTTIDGYVNQCTPYAGLTVSQVHDTAGECLFDKVCTDSIGGAVTPTELANCLNQLNRWSERYSD